MRRSMRVMAPGLAALAGAVIFCVAAIAQEQARSTYVVSAKAGGVNAVSGGVLVTRKGADAAQDASIRDDFASGDRLATSADGRAEILLNPGSYLRLAENSEIELTEVSLDSLRLKLLGGSAFIEVMSASEEFPPIEVMTPHTKVAIPRRGLYRIDALAENATVVRVRKGRALVGDGAVTEVKEGTEISSIGAARRRSRNSIERSSTLSTCGAGNAPRRSPRPTASSRNSRSPAPTRATGAALSNGGVSTGTGSTTRSLAGTHSCRTTVDGLRPTVTAIATASGPDFMSLASPATVAAMASAVTVIVSAVTVMAGLAPSFIGAAICHPVITAEVITRPVITVDGGISLFATVSVVRV